LATYFLNFKNKTFDITAGYFYEQFGSGLILRTWEDRALGINNALRGIRATVKPTEYLTLTGLYGQQRTGFELAEGKILGFNTDVFLNKFEDQDYTNEAFGAHQIISPEQRQKLTSGAGYYGVDLTIINKHFVISTLSELPANKFEEAQSLIKANATKNMKKEDEKG
jgi:hypothetical protein